MTKPRPHLRYKVELLEILKVERARLERFLDAQDHIAA